MGQKVTGRYRARRGRDVLAVGTTPNHVLHLLLGVLTCGLWLVMWAVIALTSVGGFRCSQCGTPV